MFAQQWSLPISQGKNYSDSKMIIGCKIAFITAEKELGHKADHSHNMKEVFDYKDMDALLIATPEHRSNRRT